MSATDWTSTEQVAAAAGVHPATITRWVRRGVLPEPQAVWGGRYGRLTRWPPHAPEQARWVKSKLEAGFTFAEIAAMLARGEFAPASSDGELGGESR